MDEVHPNSTNTFNLLNSNKSAIQCVQNYDYYGGTEKWLLGWF